MSGSGREALEELWEWLEGPPGFTGVFGRPSRICGSVRKALPDLRE